MGMSPTTTTKERRTEYARFLLTFIFLGFLMKISSEFVHEMGHALFVLSFGGKILGISIRAEWPFTLSHTKWVLSNPSDLKFALIAMGGIIVETSTSIIGQLILFFRKKIHPIFAISLFWLSFWTYLSSAVYLVMGAIHPFGDILDLNNAIPVPSLLIGSLGVVILGSSTYILSIILRGIFSHVLEYPTASDAVSYFWAFLHTFFVLVTIMNYGLPAPPAITVAAMVVIFIWSYISARWLLVFVSRLKDSEKIWLPRYVKSSLKSLNVEEDRNRRLKLGYAALFSVALISTILTGYMISQYLNTYSLVMKTNIEIDVTYFELNPKGPLLNLNVSVFNPTSKNMTLQRIEFDVKLNSKFMEHQVLRTIPTARPGSYIMFTHAITLPQDRMFTIEEAAEDGRWEWTISGSGYINTLFGETLLRFMSISTCEPIVS